ncbi:MAG: protein-L-isoaspartate(D-aspartate) O-methyltransferase [Alphaproteobacteria bacterium]|nr:MAG: protein-L-isoaspartate(D-aspartate) O-methyltransferase [Alphaproteobacteria bacterium]
MVFDPRVIRLIMDLRTGGVSDTEVLSAIERVPRHLFVPDSLQDQAYDNAALPIGHGQTISQPLIVALMCHALEPDKKIKVLEIGTGSGYQAAVLSFLFRRVYSIELHKPLLDEANAKLANAGITNVTTKLGDGYQGWVEQKPFERIIVSAAATEIPQTLVDQLADGGIMVIPVGPQDGAQYVIKLTKTGDSYTQETLWSVQFVPFISTNNGPNNQQKRKIS